MHSARFVEYSAKTMKDLVHNQLLKLAGKLAAVGAAVDLQDVLLRFTFDNICMAAFGIGPGCLAVDLPEVPFARAFEEATEKTLFRFMVPPFIWKTMKLFDIGSEYHLRLAVEVVHEFAEKAVRDRQSECLQLDSLSDRSDLLSRLIEAQQVCRNKYPNKFLKDFCISFILAGRDTSSVALAWFFWLIHNHPRVENLILQEITSIVDLRHEKTKFKSSATLQTISHDDVVFTVDELKKMNYLQAALSEALRLYPSVPIDFKEVLEDDVFPSGASVKKGARVLYCMYSMGRSEAIWGTDCREYKPERWIKEGQFMSENQFKYAVFNAGPRLCVGKKFAYMQMKMVAATVLARYSVAVVEGHVVAPKITTTLYMKNGLQVTFRPRKHDLNQQTLITNVSLQ